MSSVPPPPPAPPPGWQGQPGQGQPGQGQQYVPQPPPGWVPYGQGPPQYAQGPYGQPFAPPRTAGKAIAALVLGIVGIVIYCTSFVCGPLALIFGVQARRQIDESNGSLSGRGMAVAGIVLGIVGCVIAVGLVLLLAVAMRDNAG